MRSAAILWGVLLCIAAAAQPTAPRSSEDSATDLSKLGYDLEGRLVVHATINGRPVVMGIDTGAAYDVLFPAAAARLGVKAHLPALTQPAPPEGRLVPDTDPCELRIGTTVVQDTFGVPELSAGIKPGIDGFLSWHSLSSNVWIFDGDQISLEDSKALPDVTGWQQLRLRPGDTLQLEVPRAGAGTGIILIDTGNPRGATLAPELWKQWLGQHGDEPSTMGAFLMIGSDVIVRRIFLASHLALGDLQITDLPVEEATYREVRIAPNYVGTLGVAGLKRLKLIVDGSHGVAYVKPSSAPPQPFPHNRLGAVFVPKDLSSDPLIAHVARGSPAEEAGIRDGDVLKKIESLDVTAWRTTPGVMPLSRFFERAAGTKRNLTIERNGHEMTVTAVFRDILSPAAVPATTQPAGSIP